MANLTRRQWLKVGLAVGGMATFALSYRDVAKRAMDGLKNGTSGKITRDRIVGNALTPEASAHPRWQQNTQQTIAMTQCFGCWTQCGVRVRVDQQTNRVLRIAGNPYHPLSHEHHVDASVPFSTAMAQLAGENGLDARSTACARGATQLEGLYSPLRILEPMKRVGKRGEGKWQRISFEQLINEVVEGGDLFGEGHVDGLRDIYAPTTPIDPQHPGFGPQSNQLLVTNTSDDGRDTFLRRFALNSFGSKNFGAHGSYCGLAYRAGSGALMGDLDKNTHVKPDWDNVEFALFMGTSPAQSGNPFKRQARQLSSARLRNDFSYVVVAPALPLTTVLAEPWSLVTGDPRQRLRAGDGDDPLDYRKPTLQRRLSGAARRTGDAARGREELDQRHASGDRRRSSRTGRTAPDARPSGRRRRQRPTGRE